MAEVGSWSVPGGKLTKQKKSQNWATESKGWNMFSLKSYPHHSDYLYMNILCLYIFLVHSAHWLFSLHCICCCNYADNPCFVHPCYIFPGDLWPSNTSSTNSSVILTDNGVKHDRCETQFLCSACWEYSTKSKHAGKRVPKWSVPRQGTNTQCQLQ